MDIEKLKILLGISGSDQDAFFQFIIDDVEETIKGYCNIKDIPKGLANTAYRMAMDIYRNENIGSGKSSDGVVASKSAGDTSVSYRTDEVFASSILKNYEPQLNRYRRLTWP